MDEWRLDRHCINGKCYCDWRISVSDICDGAHALQVVYYVDIAMTAFVFVIGTALLLYRFFIKGHRFIDTANSHQNCFRPKPIDSMLLMLMTFCVLRILNAVLLIIDVLPDNMIFRNWMFEFPWQFGYGGFAVYLIGVAQTLANSHKAISTGWLPSPRIVDIVGCSILLAPFVVNNPVMLATGAVSQRNEYAGQAMLKFHYCIWCFHVTSLSCAVTYSGTRLVRILNGHLAKFPTTGPRYVSVKTGILKIKAFMGTIVVCLMSFGVFMVVYIILRNHIMEDTTGNIILSFVWNLLGPVTILCVEITIVINPSTGLNLGSSTDNASNNYDTEYSTVASRGKQDSTLSNDGIMLSQKLGDLKASMANGDDHLNSLPTDKYAGTAFQAESTHQRSAVQTISPQQFDAYKPKNIGGGHTVVDAFHYADHYSSQIYLVNNASNNNGRV